MICRSRKKIFGIVQIAWKYFYVKEESPLSFIFFFPTTTNAGAAEKDKKHWEIMRSSWSTIICRWCWVKNRHKLRQSGRNTARRLKIFCWKSQLPEGSILTWLCKSRFALPAGFVPACRGAELVAIPILAAARSDLGSGPREGSAVSFTHTCQLQSSGGFHFGVDQDNFVPATLLSNPVCWVTPGLLTTSTWVNCI